MATSDETVLNAEQFSFLQDVKHPPDFREWVKPLHADNVIRVWDMERGRTKKAFRDERPECYQQNGFSSMVFKPDKTALASSSECGGIQLWDIETEANNVFTTIKPDRNITALAFSRKGEFLASGNTDGVIKLLNLSTKTETEFSSGTNKDRVEWIAFSLDDQMLVCYFQNAAIRIWDVKTRKLTDDFLADKDQKNQFRSSKLFRTFISKSVCLLPMTTDFMLCMSMVGESPFTIITKTFSTEAMIDWWHG